ncbi:MAG: BLUF domain-containing protein [Planctomycetota bacterium]
MDAASQRVESSVAYVSQAACPFDEQRIANLANEAASNNATLAVTGYLYFANGRFVQCLEGDHAVVTRLLARIEHDTRHDIIATTWQSGETERRFPSWSMRWVRSNEMAKIGLEHILADQILLDARVRGGDLSFQESIWRVVDSVAESIHNRGE